MLASAVILGALALAGCSELRTYTLTDDSPSDVYICGPKKRFRPLLQQEMTCVPVEVLVKELAKACAPPPDKD